MYTQIQPLIMKTPQDFQENKQSNITTSVDQNKQLLLFEEIIIKNDEEEEATGSSSRNEDNNNDNNPVEENDDGYKTPTSPSHRIPTPVQCPPAPRKPLPPRLKRKASSSPSVCRRLQFHEPVDVESIFRAMSDQDNNVEETKTKKARRTEKD